MEDFVNDELHQQNEDHQPHQEPEARDGQFYSGTGVGYTEHIYQGAEAPEEPASTQVPPVFPPRGNDQPHGPKPGKPKHRRRRVWRTVLAGVLTLALVAGSCGLTAWMINDRWSAELQRTNENLTEQIQNLQKQIAAASDAAAGNSVSGSPVSSEGLTPSQVYARNVDSVVLITCQVQTNVYGNIASGVSSGSGFVLSDNGYVVTNCHVVEGAVSVTVTTYGGNEYNATIIGTDSTNDVAVLKIAEENLPEGGLSAVTLGSSDELIVGDQVVAIGNPLGELTSTMTVGYVSAKDRDVTTDDTTINMIQTDVAINSGNSGGPLFNMKGQVVGITTAKYSGSSSSGATIEGIGFAIPIDDVAGMIDDLANFGYVTGAYLGVSVTEVDSAAKVYGVPGGAHVVEVVDGYCAKEAGIQEGDIITGLGGYSVDTYTDLSRALRKFKAGDTTEITVYRNGQSLTLPITLSEKPHEQSGQAPVQSEEMPQNGTYEEWYKYFFGNGRNGG